MRKRTMFRGPVGFTPAESKIAAGLAVVVLLSTGIVLYKRLVRPAPRVYFETYTIPRAVDDDAASPASAEPTAAGHAEAPAFPWTGGRLDINAADYADLVRLPGIGPVLATRIMEYRDHHGPFPVVDSLLCVSGIGPKKLDKLRSSIHVP